MGLTATLTGASGTVTLDEMSTIAGRSLVDISVGSPVYANKRFHAAGPDGNLVIRGGQTDLRIHLTVKYKGALETAIANFEADKAQYSSEAMLITWAGQSHSPMNLVDDSVQTTKIRPSQLTGVGCIHFDASFEFRQD